MLKICCDFSIHDENDHFQSCICRTIINGLCYLATFVFGINAVGLVLYAGQIFINDEFKSEGTEKQSKNQSGSPTSMVESPTDTAVDNNKGDESSDEPQ